MKYIVDNKHREFFAENGWIEFEQLLTPDQLVNAWNGVSGALAKRLDTDPSRLLKYPASESLLKGRDLWRDAKEVKELVCQRKLAEIAANLVDVSPIRLAYDQLLIGSSTKEPALQTSMALEESSSIQGILCGLILCLKKDSQEPSESDVEKAVSPLPRLAGNGVYVSPDRLIDFPALLSTAGEAYLLIVYCRAVSLYVQKNKDLHAYALKSFGYGFGDKLVDLYHPVLYR